MTAGASALQVEVDGGKTPPGQWFRLRRGCLWQIYAGAAFLLAGGYYVLADDGVSGPVRVAIYSTVSASAAVAVCAGVAIWRPRPRRPWLLLGFSQVVYAAADITFYTYHDVLGRTAFPAPADVLYLAHYPFLAVALFELLRLRAPRRSWAGLLDAATLAVAAALLSWLFLIQPAAHASTTLPTRIVAVGYPVLDLAMLAVALRLVLERGRRPASFFLICAYLTGIFAADSWYVLQQLAGTYETGDTIDVIWLAGSIALGAAALHPTMARLAEPGRSESSTPGPLRIAVLTAAALIAPVVLAVEHLRGNDQHDLTIAADCAFLFLLTILRMTGLVGEQRRLAITDGLTGLATRRFLETRLAAEVDRSRRGGGSVGLILLDVDHFKLVNDRYGHPAGDRVLIELARRLRKAGPAGVLARFGGEEFALLVRHTDPEELTAIAERLRTGVAAAPMPVRGQIRVPVTVSVGAATFPEHADDLDELIGVVDGALYAAKDRGRDRVVVGPATRPGPLTGDAGGRMLEYLSFVAEDVDGRLSGHEHSSAISRWARTLCREIGLDADEVRDAELAGRLHDVGKIVIPEELLTKPSELSELEWRVMAEHAEHGFRLTRSVPGLAGVAEIIQQHHERYDGLGYPNHLRGELIRVEARIISICDSWAAMRADRLYQGTLTEELAQAELLRGRGSQFDGTLVELFLDLWQRGLVGDLRRLRPNPGMPVPQRDPRDAVATAVSP